MPEVTFLPSNKKLQIDTGTELLDAIREAGMEIESPCGGKGSCGKCVVQIVEGTADSDSLGLLSEEAVAEGYVLACKTKVNDTPLKIRIDERIGKDGGKFLEDDDESMLIDPELLPQPHQLEPLVRKLFLKIPAPQLEDGLSDLDRITRTLQQNYPDKAINFPLPVLQSTAEALRQEEGQVTLTLAQSAEQIQVLEIESGNQTDKNFGIAVDVGTTTVAVQLVDLTDGKIIGTKSAYNEQIECGLDVISRINYARRPDRLAELQNRILNTINQLIFQLCRNHQIESRRIYAGAISGNTTMVHLLLGLKPEYIRLDPYTPTVLEVPFLSAEVIGIEIHPQAQLYFAPAVGSYVGGDITSGLLCTRLAMDSEEIQLFIDIGTNGELVIGNGDFLMTCACSAGPAFEGGGIKSGMRAAIGAIDDAAIDPETGVAQYRMIGNVPPKGICGSGMIALLASLFLTGWIDAAGKFNRHQPSPAIRVNGRVAEYTIFPAEQSAIGKAITINETEIENIIRAKAAIYSAISLILDQLELGFADIDRIYIAGGFGRYLDLENAITIGLIPDMPREKFKYIGNSSLMGAYMVLVSAEHRQRQTELKQRMTYLELNTSPAYMDQYTGALFLPHTDAARFPTVEREVLRISS